MQESLLILFLLLSAFFSGSETVFLSVNRIRLEGFRHRGKMGAQSATWFLRRPTRFILTTLVGTNFANIAFSSLLTAYLLRKSVPSGWILPISTILVLIFWEIIPKSLGRDFADPGSLWVAPLLRFFRLILYPFNRITRWITFSILAIFGVKPEEVRQFFTKRDLEVLIRESARSGIIPSHRESLIYRILHFRSLRARDVMTPRTEIIALEQSSSLEDLRKIVMSSGYSRIPVYQNDIEHIIGVAYAIDLFDKHKELKDFVRPVEFFPDQKKAWEILRDLRREHQTIALIVDEWGGTAGLVTIEDLVEELTGEIEDEYDEARLTIQQLDENRWMVSGRMEVDEINHRFDLDIPEGDYETISGYLIDALERIPDKGETVELGDYLYEIAKVTRTRIRVVVIKRIAADKE